MSSMNNILVFIAIVLNIIVVHAKSDPCAEFKTCGQCIGNSLKCVWCPDPNHSVARCASSLGALKPSSNPWCSSPMNPQTQTPVITRNEEFRSIKSGHSTIQLKPQNISIKVRPGDDIEFEVHYRPAEDYPIDIYYLFDNSFSMTSHKEKLVEQARDMKIALEKMSNNVRFGAGSFVEKLALPYADEAAGQKLNTFNNHVSLTGDIAKFVEIVKEVTYTSNYDDPESGLDALMQVMVCDKEINWRPNARRMIIYLTDSTYHSAGDGKIVGAYKPHDMKCHLEPTPKEKYITHVYGKNASLTYDYPSVSQISKIAHEGKFSIFFTTLKKVSKEYQALAKAIQKAHYFELKEININVKESGSNLVEFISQEYQKLVRTLTFDEEVPPYVQMTLNPDCNQKSCDIRYDETITINGKIKITRCPREDEPSLMKIWPSGLEETLNIETEVHCQCECEKEGKGEANSTKCSNIGTLQCGVCKCNTNRYGENCQCEGTSTEERDQQLCKASSNDTHACSQRGECKCGICKCSDGFDGAHCQFRTNACPMFENKVCGNQGKCVDEECKCYPGYTGADCSCSTSTDMCIGANSQICSGNGKCTCGLCVCTHFDKRNNFYRGKFCDLCDTCIEDRCKELGDYVVCNYDGKKSKCDETFHVKNQCTVMIKNQTEINGWVAGNKCVKELDDHSSVVFKYLDGNNATIIWIQKEKELPLEINKWVAFGSAIGVILLIGILTLIAWKILVDVHDSREYKKFIEESTAEGFEVSENPLYSPPQIRIKNPAYEG